MILPDLSVEEIVSLLRAGRTVDVMLPCGVPVKLVPNVHNIPSVVEYSQAVNGIWVKFPEDFGADRSSLYISGRNWDFFARLSAALDRQRDD
jgi:hypothetical protein